MLMLVRMPGLLRWDNKQLNMNYALWGKQNFVNNIKNSFFYKKFIKNLFSTKGRTNRKEYITRLLMTILLYIVSNFIYKLSYLGDNFLLNIICTS